MKRPRVLPYLALSLITVTPGFGLPQPTLQRTLDPEILELRWSGREGQQYDLLESSDLVVWDGRESRPRVSNGEDQTERLNLDAEPVFFRIFSDPNQMFRLPVPASGLRYNSYADFDGPRWPTAYGTGHVTLWHKGRFSAYSITIDDNNAPDFPFWLGVAEDYGWKLTWFVIIHPYVWDIYQNRQGSNTGYFGTLAQFGELAQLGHDIQLHGSCASMNNLTAEAYEEHFILSRDLLSQATGQPVITYAYPCGNLSSNDGTHNYLPVVRKHLIAGRGTQGGVTPVHLGDFLNTRSLGANFLEGGQPRTLFARYKDKRNFLHSQYRGWCVTLYHGMNDSAKAQALELFDWLKANEGDFWVAPFTEVAKYAQQRESSTLTITEVLPDRIGFSLTDQMDDEIYDHPLTVKLRLNDSWTNLSATQNGSPIPAHLVLHEGTPYVYVEAIPDRGPVVVDRL